MFTDIEGSTRLVHELGDAYGDVLADQRRILRAVWDRWRGVERSTEGDSFFVVFPSAADAVSAAAEGQRRLDAHTWPHDCTVRVRMGMHTGETLVVDQDYFGIDVNRAARIAGTAHGGQIVLSKATHDRLEPFPEGLGLKDLGEHRLKDIDQPEWLFQLTGDGLRDAFPPLRSLEIPTNLPHPGTALIGRERETAELASMLEREETRLVTLTGPGGAGKTRLAIEVASSIRERFPNGVFFVALDAVAEQADVLRAIAQAAGVEVGNQPLHERLADEFRPRSILLVLDNFEHVAAAAPQIAALIAVAPRVKAIATSQTFLRISAEREYPVGPLATQGQDGGSAAAALFVARVRAAKPGYEPGTEELRTIEEICTRLDGLPLAIELAAARVRMLTPQQILERLSSSLTLLKGGSHDLPARQQTLRDTIRWSYDLLDPTAADLFRRLSVFAGPVTTDAVNEVALVDGDVIELLELLVDHNLVIATNHDPIRFTMLQTIREFAGELLDASDDAATIRDAHAAYFAAFAERGDEHLRAAGQAEWRPRLAAEMANFRAALAWCFDDRAPSERSDTGTRLAAALGRFWYTQAHAVEGCRWLTAARARAPGSDVELRARIDQRLGILHDQRGEHEPAARLFEEALAGYRELGDQVGIAASLNSLGSAARNAGDVVRARSYFEESLSIRRSLGDAVGEASCLHNLAVIALDEKDGGRALALFEQGTALDEEAGNDWGVAIDACGMADASLLLGDVDRADRLVRDALGKLASIDERDWAAEALSVASAVAAVRGDAMKAARIGAAAWETWRSIGVPPIGKDLERHEERVALAAERLTEEALKRARSEGEAMTFAQAVSYALRTDRD